MLGALSGRARDLRCQKATSLRHQIPTMTRIYDVKMATEMTIVEEISETTPLDRLRQGAGPRAPTGPPGPRLTRGVQRWGELCAHRSVGAGSPHQRATLRARRGVLPSSPVLTLATQRQHQGLSVRGPLEDVTTLEAKDRYH